MKKLVSLILALSMLLCFAACGKSGGEVEKNSDGVRTTLNIGVCDEAWEAADLIVSDTFYDIQMNCAEPLFLYNHDTGELEACLATKPEFSEDGTVMTFEIPEGRTFYNGAELGPDDVKASLEHAINDGAMSDLMSIITDIQTDGRRVTVTMEYYSSAMLICLVSPFFCVIDTAELESLSPDDRIWGVHPFGAYYIDQYVEGGYVILKRNEGYATLNETLENKGPAYIETVKINFYEDEFAAINAFRTKEIEFVINLTEDGLDQLSQLDGVTVNSTLPPMVRNLQLNCTTSVLADENLRLAIAYLIDRSNIVDTFGGDMCCTPAYSYITQNVLYHNDASDEYYKANYCNDREKAMALIAESGWTDTDGDGILDKDGQKLTLRFLTASGKNETAAIAIQKQLTDAGFDVQLSTMTSSLVNETVGNKDYDIAMVNYWWSEPGRFLYKCFKDNDNGVDLDASRKMCLAVESSMDPDETFRLVDETQRYLMDTLTVIPLYTTSYIKAYYSDLEPHFIVDGLFLGDCK